MLTAKEAKVRWDKGSAGSGPASVVSRRAASVTLRAIGPAVSIFLFRGTMPDELIKPVVGRKPTVEVNAAGVRTEVSVSSPTATAVRLAATATPEPLLEPPGTRFSL